jgi:hypothetical protein
VRTMTMRPWLYQELAEWRDRLRSLAIAADEDDFIVPGAAPDGHYTLEQQHNFIRDVKLCGRVAADCDAALAFLLKTTPYSLRRGHISLRVLAREDIRRIADDCGTSTAMIHRHYLHELDMRHDTPKHFSFDGAVEAARREVRGARPPDAAAARCPDEALRSCLVLVYTQGSIDRQPHRFLRPRAVPRQYGRLASPRLLARKTRLCRSFALLAQLVEHFHGKEGVAGSSPAEGFDRNAR